MESKRFHHTSPMKYILFSKMIALHQNTLTVLTLRWSVVAQGIWMGQVCMTDAVTAQDYFILALPLGGLPISQDGLDTSGACSRPHHSNHFANGNNILVNMVFRVSVGYTNLDTRQIQNRIGSRICLFIAPNANMAGYPTKLKNTPFHITIPTKQCSSFIYCKAWRHKT